ncbi:putative acetyltransferase At3g50280 [Silene latifolia]|uniref:putative acetyltransferase At3g50280 n=1 Tax=Silene latifolia TaxID=37657 RepID=UPI003D77918B
MGSRSQGSHTLTLLSECFVKPPNLDNKEAPKKLTYLGGTDLFMLALDTMQKGLLFDTKLQPDFLAKLKKSLYISLIHFYPLAGQLGIQKFDNEQTCCFYVDCEAGPGARLLHASVNNSVSDIVSSVDVHPIVEFFFDLGEKSINYEGHTRPLLSVQVTELVDGFFIGFTMNHCIADGTSLWHFISTLSEIFCQVKDNDKNEYREVHEVSISRKPIIETLFPSGGYGPTFRLPYLKPDEFVNRYKYDPGPLRVRIFHFSPKSISMLKSKANEECGLQNNISSFQALCAFMWQSITRARNLRTEDETRLSIPMNARTRFNPPFPDEYFRNSITVAKGETKVGDLMSNSLGHAALIVNQCIKMQDGTYYRKLAKYFEENACVVPRGSASANVTIGGSPRFDMYGPKFGVGKAVAVLAGYASKDDGKVTANPGCEGSGSVDLEVCLRPENMNALELDEEFMSFVSTI